MDTLPSISGREKLHKIKNLIQKGDYYSVRDIINKNISEINVELKMLQEYYFKPNYEKNKYKNDLLIRKIAILFGETYEFIKHFLIIDNDRSSRNFFRIKLAREAEDECNKLKERFVSLTRKIQNQELSIRSSEDKENVNSINRRDIKSNENELITK